MYLVLQKQELNSVQQASTNERTTRYAGIWREDCRTPLATKDELAIKETTMEHEGKDKEATVNKDAVMKGTKGIDPEQNAKPSKKDGKENEKKAGNANAIRSYKDEKQQRQKKIS